MNLNITQRRRNSYRGDFSTVPPHHSSIRSDPQLLLSQGEQAVDPTIELSTRRAKNSSLAHIEEPFVLGPKPHRAIGSFSHRNDDRVGFRKAVRRELRGPTETGGAIVGFRRCGPIRGCSVGRRSENFKSSGTV